MMTSPFFTEIENKSLRAELLRTIRNEWTHDSTAIEGNSLTLGDTDFVLSEGLTIGGKPLSHHKEVYGHARAIDLIYGMLKKSTLDESDVLLLHKAVMSDVIIDIFYPIGEWKNEPNFTFFVKDGKRAQHEYPHPEVIPTLMLQWIDLANEMSASIETAEDACASYAELHAKFVAIHPFVDGNGRMARLLANWPLLKNGFPPINIPSIERRCYLDMISNVTCQCGNVCFQRDIDLVVDKQAIKIFELACREWWKPVIDLIDNAIARDRELRQSVSFKP